MIKIIILGSSGGCFDLLDLIKDINKANESYEVIGFLDDRFNDKLCGGYRILGKFSDWSNFDIDIQFATAIGSELNFRERKNLIEDLCIPMHRWPSLIHPTAVVSNDAEISNTGVVVHAFCKISTNVKIGKHALLLPSTIVNHDSIVGEYSILNTLTNISGSVIIGELTYIGAGCTILPNVKIGEKTLIGAGSLLTKDAIGHAQYYGHPAKERK